jgi:hypothetical protein
MANTADILINATWKGGPQVKKAGADMRQLGNNATRTSGEVATANKKSGLSFGALTTTAFAASAAVAGVTIAASKLYRTLRAGAELEATAIRFDRLAESIGTTGDALRADLGIAVQGLVSDTEAMALATDFMALGLTKTHDEAVRLASVAGQLGFNMNQLVLTLTNQTTMRFDALGVSVDGFEEKVEALEEAGLDADEAFRFAFIEQAEEQIERVGSRAETTAGQLDILEASTANAFDNFKLALTEDLSPIIEGLVSGTVATNEMVAALSKLERAGDNLDEQAKAIEDFRKALSDLRGESERGVLPNEQLANAYLNFVAALVDTGATAEEQKDTLRELGFEVEEDTVSVEGFTVAWEQLEEAINRTRKEAIAPFVQRDGPEMVAIMEAFTANTKEAVDPLEALVAEFNKLIEDFETIDAGELLEMTETSIEQFAALTEQLGGTAEAVQFLQAVVRDLEINPEQLGIDEDLLEDVEQRRTDRAELFRDFQLDLTDITERESELRSDTEETFEQRRTDIVRDFGQRRAQEEASWNRRRERQDRDFQRRLDDVQEDSIERQQELREQANQRLADLERDHLDRMREIIEDADLDLADAASRLDAKAVAAITKRRDDALEDEEESFKRQQDRIKRELAERIKAEQEASRERIQEMREFHEQRKRDEAEDRQIRLQQQQEEHEERLKQLEQQKEARLVEIRLEAAQERLAREREYRNNRIQLDRQWRDRSAQNQFWMDSILLAEEAFWQARLDMVPAGGGGTGGGGGGGGAPASHSWLVNTLLEVVNANTPELVALWMDWVNKVSDATIARYIESHSNIDVPGYATGIRNTPGGLALVGERGPELVGLPAGSQVFNAATTRQLLSGSVQVDALTINVNEAMRPGDTAKEVRREMTRVFEELAA